MNNQTTPLIQSEFSILSLINNLPGPACVTDMEYSILASNDLFGKIFGYKKNSLSLKDNSNSSTEENLLNILHHEILTVSEGTLSSAHKNVRYDSEEGDTFWYKVHVTSFQDEGDNRFLFISGCDITAQYALSTQQNRFNTLLEFIRGITESHLFDSHPEEQIQQVISRVGMVMKVRYSSYLEIDQTSPQFIIRERCLWSDRSGYCIGADVDKFGQDSVFTSLLSDLNAHIPIVIRRSHAKGFICQLLDERQSGSLVVVPLMQHNRLFGILLLFDESESRLWLQAELTTLMILAVELKVRLAGRQIKEVLVQSEQKFQSLIDQIGDMYFMTDKSGFLIRVSPSMAKNLGYPSVQSLEGNPFENIVHPPEFWPLFLSDIISGEGVKDYEIQLLAFDKRILYSSISCRLVYDDGGFLQGIEGVIRDISRRKQYGDLLSDIEWKLEQAQKVAKMGVWSYDKHMERFGVSHEVFSLLGIPPDQNFVTIDGFLSRISSQDTEKIVCYFRQDMCEGLDFDVEFRISLEDKKFRYLKMKGKPLIKKGIIQGSFGILQDITDRKDVENHLMKYATELEEKTMEIDATRNQLLDMNRDLDMRVRKRTAEIENLLKQKDEFIQIIGHDLKTPLTPLVALLPYIRKKITDPELCTTLDMLIEDVTTIRKLITTILDLAKMNCLYVTSDLQCIHLKEVTDLIISDNAYLIHQKSLLIENEIPDDFSIMMSPIHFDAVFGNIFGNAIKYSYINGKVSIYGANHPNSVIITVQDNGIGITPEHLPRIFEEFYCADTSRHDRGSHGLGLAIAKRIVEMYHGTISVYSEGLEKGTTFSLRLKKNPDMQVKDGGLLNSMHEPEKGGENGR